MDYAQVKVLISFNGLKAGQETVLEGPWARAYADLGFVEVTDDGKSSVGQGSAEPDSAGELPGDGGDGGEAGGGEGEGTRPRRHRKAASVDPGGEA